MLCEPGYETEVKSSFSKYQMLINDAKHAHNTLLKLYPRKKRKNMKIKAKLLSLNEFSQIVTTYLSCSSDGVPVNEVNTSDDELKPRNSVSNVGLVTSRLSNKSRSSSRSNQSSKSSVETAQAQAEGKRAEHLTCSMSK